MQLSPPPLPAAGVFPLGLGAGLDEMLLGPTAKTLHGLRSDKDITNEAFYLKAEHQVEVTSTAGSRGAGGAAAPPVGDPKNVFTLKQIH